jgi:hypothetical protein
MSRALLFILHVNSKAHVSVALKRKAPHLTDHRDSIRKNRRLGIQPFVLKPANEAALRHKDKTRLEDLCVAMKLTKEDFMEVIVGARFKLLR